jgi:peroxiredoxin
MTSRSVARRLGTRSRKCLIGGLLFSLAVVLSVWLAGCAKAPVKGPQRLKAGDTAPAFLLADIADGSEINGGKVFQGNAGTVVILWSMTCPTCREALVACQRVYEEYGGKAMAFVGINFDQENLQGVRAFLKAEGITFQNAWDPRARVTRTYRAVDYTFSVFVVDSGARVLLAQYDHPPDLEAVLSKTLDGLLVK